MWEPRVSVSELLTLLLWLLAIVLIGLGWYLDIAALGQLGVLSGAVAATLVVVKDNRRTRQLIRRAINRISSRLS